ncbi:hypothetical protein QQS21_010209 [Conoideocrella luteorostrata]|uniref:chitinase n=1 Tax=Conoideocrella luteorostrata TaxID=1105319 RepID=A0AAJ0CFH2_9HYPO|nr:hypothetical protein QQS21_010209 [Conoideocrella luteorostrata]
MTASAPPAAFNSASGSSYEPFWPLDAVRGLFNDGTKVCMSIGGQNDTIGFSNGAASSVSRKLYAKNVAATVERLGYDCVDIDWEYPTGEEMGNYLLLLSEMKATLGKKELSTVVPGRLDDMAAFNTQHVWNISRIVDFVNVAAFDLVGPRDNLTNHHSSFKDSKAVINSYIELGMPPPKMTLGFGLAVRWYKTQTGVSCTGPKDCARDSAKTHGKSNVEMKSFTSNPALSNAIENGYLDTAEGAHWYWDAKSSMLFSWDNTTSIEWKFQSTVEFLGLGGVSVWSLCEDGFQFARLQAIQRGMETLT